MSEEEFDIEKAPKATIVIGISWEKEKVDEDSTNDTDELTSIAMRFDTSKTQITVNTFAVNRDRVRLIGPLKKRFGEYNDITGTLINNLIINNEVWRLTSSFDRKYTIKAIRGIVRYIFVDINRRIVSDFLDPDRNGKKIATKIYEHDVENYDKERFVNRIKALLVVTYALIGSYNIRIENTEYETQVIESFRHTRRLLLKTMAQKELWSSNKGS